MISGSIGRRYAKALLDLSRETGKVEETLSELESFGKVLRESSDLRLLMSDPAFASEERKKTLESLSKPLKFSPALLHFLSLLIDRDRMAQFGEILLSYRAQSDQVLGRVRVQVTIPELLGEASEKKLKKILEKITGKQVILDMKTDPSILGGMVIKVQDQMFDGSVKASLRQMKQKMMQVPIQ